MPNAASALDASGVLLRDLIDYAGLFPPAALPMPLAVANYEQYSSSESNWILGRFVVPASRLDEFERALAELPAAARPPATWRLTVLLGADPNSDIALLRKFRERVNQRTTERTTEGTTKSPAKTNATPVLTVESVEVRAAGPEEVNQLSRIILPELTAYFEVAPPDLSQTIAAIAACGRRAKIRTGGETADKFPAPESVVEFIRLCAAARVPFKATAGLHHPLRSVHRFTYQPDSDAGTMHGFVNVFLAAAFLWAGMEHNSAVQLLEERSSTAFRFSPEEIRWRSHRLSRQHIADARRSFAISFGSCSFSEPIDDLRSLRVL